MVRLPPKKLISVVLLLLSGCFNQGNYAPVIDYKERTWNVPKAHIVERGDTLYSIAWRYHIDVKRLASTNKIKAPYLIYPGQKIQLKTVTTRSKKSKISISDTSRNTSQVHAKQVANSAKRTPVLTPSVKGRKVKSSASSLRWRWPAKGRVGRLYSEKGGVHKGIDIEGKLGESVHAASSGKVVYAGSGLVGYGILLIIKHNENYLSAYGHNSKLLVTEGELVKVGQQVAEIGDTGTDKVKLHFEIRHKGIPIDPLKLLPKG